MQMPLKLFRVKNYRRIYTLKGGTYISKDPLLQLSHLPWDRLSFPIIFSLCISRMFVIWITIVILADIPYFSALARIIVSDPTAIKQTLD